MGKIDFKKYIFPSIIFVWFVLLLGVFKDNGLIHIYKVWKIQRQLTLQVRALEKEKEEHTRTLDSLEHDPFVQEQAIRDSLGFVRDKELIFEFR